MLALTIHNPFPYLILTPQTELPAGAHVKRVENRLWSTRHRGTMAVHAGMSLDWFFESDWPEEIWAQSQVPQMPFGAVVGVVDLVGVYSRELINVGNCPFSWVREHKHTIGPFCWILDNPRKLRFPVPCVGHQKLWSLTPDDERKVREQLEGNT